MPFPEGWPPRYPSGRRSLRYYVTDTATADFHDKAYLFIAGAGANPYLPTPVVVPGQQTVFGDVFAASPPNTHPTSPMGGGRNPVDTVPGGAPQPVALIWAQAILVRAEGAALEFSFDGVNVHGRLASGQERIYRDRYEAGIAVRGVGATFYIEAW